MKEIKAYKSENGRIYEYIEDAQAADNKLKEKRDFKTLVSIQNYPDNYGTSFDNWDCKQSPVGKCVYDYNSDWGEDDCIYCHNTDERK